MNKTIDERLFEQLMKAPHGLHRAMMKNRPEGCKGGPGCGPKGRPEGPGFPGHKGPGFPGPMGHGPHGPMAEGPGHKGMPGGFVHGGHGHHGMPGPEGMPGHGPMGHGRGRRMRAFAQERMLGTLAEYETGIRQKELVEALGINPSSVSELISKLEGEGYVTRTVDPSDKRATLIGLTEVGRARAYELEDERNERFSNLFTGLTEKEKEQLLKLLEKLAASQEEQEDQE